MKEHKKYTDIVRLGHQSTHDVLKVGDLISISEKIDGTNVHFILDNDSDIGVSCFSKRIQVTKENTLRGYYGWVITNIIPIKNKLNPNYRYFGEYLVSHTVKYKPEMYNNFYLFSIWDEENNTYLSDDIVKSEAIKLGLKTPEYFYEGEYISFEHLMSFVGKSNITLVENTGEGIVVKNVNYRDRYGNQLFVKLVSEKFAEVQKQRPPKNPNVDDLEIAQIKSILTEARVRKLLFKLVDEGIISEEFGIEDMGIILKNLGSSVYEDMIKEESEFLSEFEEKVIKKTIGKTIPNMVKTIINNK